MMGCEEFLLNYNLEDDDDDSLYEEWDDQSYYEEETDLDMEGVELNQDQRLRKGW